MFPPLHRFWPSYFVTISIFIGLFVVGIKIFHMELETAPTVLAIYTGVWVAFISIVSSSWSQWRTSSVQHAMSALQALRTDREYLINAYVIKEEILNSGETLNDEIIQKFLDTSQPSTIDDPSFADASRFVLNQYEFLAAAARQGAVDMELLQETIAGLLRNLVKTYTPVIAHLRAENKNTFKNLVWLYREQNPKPEVVLDLGP